MDGFNKGSKIYERKKRMRTRPKGSRAGSEENTPQWKGRCSTIWGAIIHLGGDCIVGASDVGFCDPCSGRLEAHHLISRSVVLTFADPDNGVLLCAHHHHYSSVCSPHGCPEKWREWLSDEHPVLSEWRRAKAMEAKTASGPGRRGNKTWMQHCAELVRLYEQRSGRKLPRCYDSTGWLDELKEKYNI